MPTVAGSSCQHHTQSIVVSNDSTVPVVFESSEAVDEIPHLAIVRVEDMRPVFVDLDALELFRVTVAGNMAPAIEDQDRQTSIGRAAREHAAVET